MSLIECPECRYEKVSNLAEICPICGFRIKKYFENLSYENSNGNCNSTNNEIDNLDDESKKILEEIRLKNKSSLNNIKQSKNYAKRMEKQNEIIKRAQLENKNEIDYTFIVGNESRKSLGNSITRGVIGGTVLGPLGLVAGVLSAKNKSKTTFTVVFKSGRREIVTVDNDSSEFYKYAKYIK